MYEVKDTYVGPVGPRYVTEVCIPYVRTQDTHAQPYMTRGIPVRIFLKSVVRIDRLQVFLLARTRTRTNRPRCFSYFGYELHTAGLTVFTLSFADLGTNLCRSLTPMVGCGEEEEEEEAVDGVRTVGETRRRAGSCLRGWRSST